MSVTGFNRARREKQRSGQAEQRNAERQAPQAEPTLAQLRKEAKGKVPNYGKMNKAELLEALR